MNKVSLSIDEIRDIMETLKKFPEVSNFEIVQEGNNGIGTVLHISFFTEINGVSGEFTTTIRDVDSW